MRILFTGASSFTGMWFVEALAKSGHNVVTVFQKREDAYSGIRKRRVDRVCKHSRPVFECSFGDDRFLSLIHEQPWDLLCHHAATVTNYKSPDFDVQAAVANNTHRLKEVLQALSKQECQRVLLTGSVFEQTATEPAVSPYGESKGITFQLFQEHAEKAHMALGKFVIPNPFGPYEEPRFTSSLAKAWLRGETPTVRTPEYIRDNIHVSLLASAYTTFAEQLSEKYQECRPSGYRETQGAFTERFASAMCPRLDLPCSFEIAQQETFSEPLKRVNTDPISLLNWNESSAWDALADYYRELFDE